MKSQTCSAYYVLPVSNPASLIPKFHSNTVLQALSVTVSEQTILQGNRKDEDQPTHRQPRAHHRQVGRALQVRRREGPPRLPNLPRRLRAGRGRIRLVHGVGRLVQEGEYRN